MSKSVSASRATATALLALAAAPGLAAAQRAYDWNGAYVGVQGGGGWMQRSFYQTTSEGPLVERGKLDADGAFGGGEIGYNWQASPRFLVGLEADGSGSDLKADTRTFNDVGTGPAWTQKVDAFGGLRGRVGWTASNWLVYGGGGLGWADDRFARTQVAAGPGTPPLGMVVSNNALRAGWTAGGGLEWGFGAQWSAKIEYDHLGFGRTSKGFVAAPGTFQFFERPLSLDVVEVGLNYSFR